MKDNSDKIILDLCGGTGRWSDPYKENGYDVRLLDWQNGGEDIRVFRYFEKPVYGILAAPPCDHLALSGARYWKEKGLSALLRALSITDACVRIAAMHGPVFWALENPVGRLRKYYGPPRLIFNPCDYGDPYTKKTLLWGNFNIPEINRVEPTQGSRMHFVGPGKSRKKIRAETPSGFAWAFYRANK